LPLRRATKIAHAMLVDTRCLEWTLATFMLGWGVWLLFLVNRTWTPVFWQQMEDGKALGLYRFLFVPLLSIRVVAILSKGQRGRKWASVFEAVYWYLIAWTLGSKGAILWQTVSAVVLFLVNLYLITQKATVEPKSAEAKGAGGDDAKGGD
jgi:hypothetical protein